MSSSFKKQFKYRGTVHALLSCLKNFVSKKQILEYKKIHAQKTPVKLIWAENDIDADVKGRRRAGGLYPEPYPPGDDHDTVHDERPEEDVPLHL